MSYQVRELLECEMCDQHIMVSKQIDKRECIPDNVVLFTYEYDGKDDDVYQYNKCILLFKIISATTQNSIIKFYQHDWHYYTDNIVPHKKKKGVHFSIQGWHDN